MLLLAEPCFFNAKYVSRKLKFESIKLFYLNERSLNQISNDTHNSISPKTELYRFCFVLRVQMFYSVYVYGTITTRISKLKVICIMYSC